MEQIVFILNVMKKERLYVNWNFVDGTENNKTVSAQNAAFVFKRR